MNLRVLASAWVASVAFVTTASAAVPAGYTGQPFKGTPWPIPGRIDLVNYDTGGLNVGFNTVHHGDVACPGTDYRNDLPVPTLCKTSQMTGQFNDKPDEYTAGPLMGMFYPNATTADYYIGAVRPGDWVNVTVNVATAGTYQLGSTFTSDGGSIDIKISFNGVLKNETKAPSTGGYHNWVPFPSFGTVDLDAGVQVLKFQSVVEHLNLDYLQFSLVTDGGVDKGGEAGTTGAGGATGSDSGPTETAGAGGAMGQGGGGAGSSSTDVAGNGGAETAGSAAAIGQGGNVAADPAPADASSGCACAIGRVPAHSGRDALACVGLLALALTSVLRTPARNRPTSSAETPSCRRGCPGSVRPPRR